MSKENTAGHLAQYVLPDMLSASRLGLAAAFVLIGGPWRAGLIALAAVTDALDGLLARAMGGRGWFGSLLDPTCDKIFALTVLTVLVVDQRMAWWQVCLLLLRDIAVGLAALAALLQRRWASIRAAQASWLGKLTTGALFVLLLVVFALPNAENTITALYIVTVILSGAAGVDYLTKYVKKGPRDQGAEGSSIFHR